MINASTLRFCAALVMAAACAQAASPAVETVAEFGRPAAVAPGQWLAEAFGPEALEALRYRGYIVMQGKPGAYRLQKVYWKQLEAVSRSAKAVQEFSQALAKIKAGETLGPSGPLPFASLQTLPPGGLMSAPLHALLFALNAYHDEETVLAGAQDPAAAPQLAAAAGPDIFTTPWGREFMSRTHADALEDPTPLVKSYFATYLAGVKTDAEPTSHFIDFMRDRYQVDISSRLAADVRAGQASDELSSWLIKYLIDQRRRHNLERLRRQVVESEKRTTLLDDLQMLEAVSAVFRARPGLMAELEGAVHSAPAPAAVPLLSSAGLHLEKPTRLGQYELGDTAVLSGAYWVDGLPDGQTAPVEETTFRETPDGARDAQTQTVKRGNGGPYAFARRIVLDSSEPFVFRAVISAPEGNILSDEIQVPVGRDFELALLKLAAADNQALSCDFKNAEESYAKLEETLAEPAQVKPQYRRLLETAGKRRSVAAQDADQFAALQEAVSLAQPDSSPQRCLYDPKPTQAAIRLAQSLPAGCDRALVDLNQQRQLITRRAADQSAFSAGVALASSLRRSCRFALAAEEYAKALAVLDADPAARCGRTAEAAARAEADLAAVRGDEFWRAKCADEIHRAQAEALPAERLSILHPLLARLGALAEPSCFAKEIKQAEALAQEAGQALALEDSVAARLTPDEDASRVIAEVANERRRLLAAAERLEDKKAAEQAPVTSGAPEQGPAEALAPPPVVSQEIEKKAPAVKKTARPSSRKRARPKTKPAPKKDSE